MTLLKDIWRKITSPVTSIQSQYERERTTLYSGLLFLMTFIFLIASTLLIFIPTQDFIFKVVFSFTSIFFTILYISSRTSFYLWSARLYIWYTIGIIIYSFLYISVGHSLYVLDFITVPIMMAGLLLPRRETILYTGITVLIIGIIQTLHPNYTLLLSGTPLLIAIVGCLTVVATSITERYYNQAINNEQRYRNLMQANFEGIVIVDKDSSQIVDTNPAFEDMIGYSSEELINQYLIQFVHPEEQDLIREVWRNEQTVSVLELQLQHKKGYLVTVEITMRPYIFLNQQVYVFTVLNISDRKQVEALIIESEKRFRSIFDESSHYLGILDSSGKVLEFNQSIYDKFGFHPNEVLGRYIWEFDNWADTDELKLYAKKFIQMVNKGKTIQIDTTVTDKDGNTTYINFSMKAIQDADSNTKMILMDSRDTTAYHLANAELKEYQQRYQAIFEHTTDAMFIYNLEGEIVSTNERAKEMLLIHSGDLEGYSIYDFVAQDEINHSKSAFKKLLAGTEFSHVPERKMKRANGEVFYAETLGMIVRDTAGNPRYVQSLIRDLTERKRQEKIRFDNALQRERTQLLGHFIDNASHYFRTPITNMKTRLYLLPRVLNKPEKQSEQVKVLNLELERLENLLNDLLTVLRLQKDDTEYSLSKIPIKQLLIELRQSFEGRSDYHNFQWVWDKQAKDAIAIGDKARLSKALFNLVKNAMTYTPNGGNIKVQSFTQDNLIAINIINSGEQINEHDLPYIFDDFYRGKDAMEKDGTGTGLGLTITKMIAERHQGRIFVQSTQSGGTHFQIVLPNHMDWKQESPSLPKTMLKINTMSG